VTIEAEALLYPLSLWLLLGAVTFAVHVAIVVWCLRPDRRGATRAAAALLAADVLLIALVRRCVGFLGAMDYSASFPVWRWGFLVLIVLAAGVPIPAWVLSLRLAVGRDDAPPSDTPAIHPTFRAALAMWAATAAIVLLAGGSFTFLPRPAQITEADILLEDLPEALDGLRIAALADHHIGPLVTPERARERLRSLPRADPDMIAVLGDITDMDPRYQPEAADVLGSFKAPLGTFAVAGNFDVRCGTDSLEDELTRVGIAYLENRAERVTADGAALWVAGVGDPWTGQDDLGAALADVPEGEFVVLLAHSPDIVEAAAERRIPLMLAGHLHGGQVVIPFAGPVVGMSKFGRRFAAGHFLVGSTHLVVSRGLGEEAVPGRLFCAPEIVVVTLRRAP
jgi:predicted MPP superfamily phosphohydrolase